jgi:hypothetical protein
VELAADPEKRARLGRRGRETVQAFSVEETIRRHVDLYTKILGQASPTPKGSSTTTRCGH